jgi:hypothetical protein
MASVDHTPVRLTRIPPVFGTGSRPGSPLSPKVRLPALRHVAGRVTGDPNSLPGKKPAGPITGSFFISTKTRANPDCAGIFPAGPE